MKSSIIVILTTAACVCADGIQALRERQANWTVGQTVQTNSGPVSGHPASNDSDVSEYLGIPFAQPPIGDLRFAEPVNFTGSSPLNGSNFSLSCPIQVSNGTSGSTNLAAANITQAGVEVLSLLSTPKGYSEDCLYLNVWTKPQTGEAKKAVLVWVYGGKFGSHTALLYRLSILGFPGGPVGTQNLGLLDQRLAIEWVRDNIANFGGDPSRITLFGQSAGAASVDFYSYAWTSDPIAQGFISESGTAYSWGLPHLATESEGYWFNVTASLGCGDASSNATEVLACMRTKDAQDILNIIPSADSVQSNILGYFGPTVDGTVIFSNYSERTPASVPLLIGNNNYEAGLFRTEFALDNVTYPDLFWDDFNIQEFTCPAGIRANASVAAKNPTWRYRYFGVFPDMAVSSEAGAWHASEVPVLFDTVPEDPTPTTEEISIGNYMRGAWAAFAKDPAKGLTTYGEGWPMYDAGAETLYDGNKFGADFGAELDRERAFEYYACFEWEEGGGGGCSRGGDCEWDSCCAVYAMKLYPFECNDCNGISTL
ncbi:Cholinesterase [Hyphodiscus hymeniophilus]|uniref:Carboxylic ester hydrolase n=1 Tax=Hyphodiscus hymeniophilus TaxID=353542 RepID=A0A9P7AXG3_9HELO|nr:Cholinesterase [Hyphodiscus hymeniophilus]